MAQFRSEEEVLSILNDKIRSNPDAVALIIRAWNFAKKAHGQQQRMSGEPHTEHLFETAKYLSELGLGASTVSAGILHDTLEDTNTSEEDLEKGFGKDIAFMVIGVTKLEKKRHGLATRQAENLRRFFISAAKDPRVLIIKLCDRLHNMNTLQYLPPKKRELIAKETLDIYVPVAERLGIDVLKRELEDLAFEQMEPDTYNENNRLFAESLKQHLPNMKEALTVLQEHLASTCPFPTKVILREKGKYSFYKKLLRKDGDTEEIKDIVTMQITVPETTDCYSVLGSVHALWRPIPKKMKDYIAFPKPNGYQCLRTAVTTDAFGIIEIHIYSEEMYARAQYGIVVDLIYNEPKVTPHGVKHRTKKLRQLFTYISKRSPKLPHTKPAL